MDLRKNLVRACRTMTYLAVFVAILLAVSGTAWAQAPADTFKVTYFDNNSLTTTGAPDATVNIVNPGVASGELCASVYVFRNDQELSECCSCLITPNGLLTFTVDVATDNPGDHAPGATSGSIDVISDSACNPANPTPTPTLRVFATHVNADSISGGFDVTETDALETTLSSGEQSELSSRCAFLEANGSGAGDCSAICTEFGASGAVKKANLKTAATK